MGLYIANFTYLVGMAAAAVLLVIPAYIYHFKPIKEIVVLGELFAASSIVMAILFVMADLGRLDRFWHMIPFIGSMNFPESLLAWDVLVLNGYLVLNLFIPVYLLVHFYYRKEPNWKFILPSSSSPSPGRSRFTRSPPFSITASRHGLSGMPRFWRRDFWRAPSARDRPS